MPPTAGIGSKLQRHVSIIGDGENLVAKQSWSKTATGCCSSPSTLLVIPSRGLHKTFEMSITTKATIASFGGKLLKLSHNASTVGCEMAFNLFLPPQSTINPLHKMPLLIYLSGLTCTPDNCSEKGFFQHGASKHGIAVLYPDTSPSEHQHAQFNFVSLVC